MKLTLNEVLDTCTSTQDIAREKIINKTIKVNEYIFSRHQSQGRGQQDKQWMSLPGEHIYTSIVLSPKHDQSKQGLYNLAMALALVLTLKEYKVKALIKWPNDVLVDCLKLSGILSQCFTHDAQNLMILGMGINVNAKSIPDELTTVATSLNLITEQNHDCFVILENVLLNFQSLLDKLCDQTFTQLFIMHAYKINEEIRFLTSKGLICGLFKGINENGHIIIETSHGLVHQASGHVLMDG